MCREGQDGSDGGKIGLMEGRTALMEGAIARAGSETPGLPISIIRVGWWKQIRNVKGPLAPEYMR